MCSEHAYDMQSRSRSVLSIPQLCRRTTCFAFCLVCYPRHNRMHPTHPCECDLCSPLRRLPRTCITHRDCLYTLSHILFVERVGPTFGIELGVAGGMRREIERERGGVRGAIVEETGGEDVIGHRMTSHDDISCHGILAYARCMDS